VRVRVAWLFERRAQFVFVICAVIRFSISVIQFQRLYTVTQSLRGGRCERCHGAIRFANELIRGDYLNYFYLCLCLCAVCDVTRRLGLGCCDMKDLMFHIVVCAQRRVAKEPGRKEGGYHLSRSTSPVPARLSCVCVIPAWPVPMHGHGLFIARRVYI